MCLRFILLFIFCLQAKGTFCQGHRLFEDKDTFVVEVDLNQSPFYTHTISSGETIYSLARFFGISYIDLLIMNGFQENQIIPLGTQIIIPIQTELLLRGRKASTTSDIPVIYRVKKQETLFKISHVYFNQKIEDLVVRNQVKKLSLSIGQELLVGWWPNIKTSTELQTEKFINQDSMFILKDDSHFELDSIQNISAELSNLKSDSLSALQSDSTQSIEVVPEIISNKGIALWDKADENTETLLALHKYARVGSVIKLQNPVTKYITIAQVVGPIPDNVYSNDIDIIISKAVAQKLGALDSRFQILMTYYE